MTKGVVDTIACPTCGTETPLVQLMQDADTREAFTRLAEASIPLGARVLQYTTLFRPPKTRLTVVKQIKLVHQLLPFIERQVITHRGREWPAPHQAWAAAIDQMLLARDQGRLELPMSGHGYLFSILSGMADKHEARQEAAREDDRRHSGRATVRVRGETMTIGQGLEAVYGDRDPALLKIEAGERNAAPVPDHVRAMREALRKGSTS